jgi:hypothetical protein
MRYLICVVAVFLTLSTNISAQSPNATLNGQVVDSSGGVIAGANIDAINIATNVKYSTRTNSEGMYLLPDLPPANYEIHVAHAGFKTIVKPDILLNVRDAVVINFALPLGAVSERVTVEGGAPLISTQDAAVSTVVDRQFAENLPLNGRSFQTLIQLTPGVVLTPSSLNDGGQFSVNGQRTSSNYWMVDGVSADIGASAFGQGNGVGGALPGFGVQGGTNSLVSVDALQEFRIQTSTYAPEFGRTPGGQISIVTRSGANQFHGTIFDYLRNDILDANDWFADNKGLKKPEERQNDFGATFSGPIFKDRTFFFFSYEGLRLRLPQTVLSTVPCDSTCAISGNARAAAIPAMQPYLNAYPLPNGTDHGDGTADFNASFSNPSTLDAYSIRIDHRIGQKLALFGRYNYSPSQDSSRSSGATSLNSRTSARIDLQTVTAGATLSISPAITNDSRFNYSRNYTNSFTAMDNFGGAVPLTASQLNFPSPFTAQNSAFGFLILSTSFLVEGNNGNILQRQLNLVDSLSVQIRSHSLKFGIDYRRLFPSSNPPSYQQTAIFFTVGSAQAGQYFIATTDASLHTELRPQNLGLFAQDTWRVRPRLTLTYGVRWDIDFAPSSDPAFAAVTSFGDLSKLALAQPGTPVFATRYGNFAPRLGVAYQVSQKQGWETVLRGGFGVFFDLATQELGNVFNATSYPFGSNNFFFFGNYPLSAAQAAPPAISVAQLASGGQLSAFDPHLNLPYTLQWNLALQQALGSTQSISASYVGAAGRRLLQTEFVSNPNPTFSNAYLVGNDGTSDYDALQLQFQRRLSRRLQALLSYNWSHSIDTASASSAGNTTANTFSRQLGAAINRGPSDFDIRHGFSAAVTYDIPAPKVNAISEAILGGWSIENIVLARSAPPVNVSESGGFFAGNPRIPVRPDLVQGQPLYIFGSQCVAVDGPPCAGGRGLNPAAFTSPPKDPKTGAALRQGTLGRNALRGFGATQWDFAAHRDIPMRESLKLQFRAEMFNVLNHPNFGQPVGTIGSPFFGEATQMLGASLQAGTLGSGALSPLYQVGGPRSIQFGLKLLF